MSSTNKSKSVLKEIQVPQHPWEKTIKNKYSNKIKYAHNSISNIVFPPLKEKKQKGSIQFTVIGVRFSKEFIYCVHLVQGMHKYRSKIFEKPIIKGVTIDEWSRLWRDLKIQYGGIAFCLLTRVAILYNGNLFGGDKELKEFIETRYVYHLCLDYRKEAVDEFAKFVKSSGRPFVYLHISIDDEPIGSMIFMLYSDLVPNTCENFIRLCKTRRGGYSGSPVHRIVKNGWIQCGGFNLKGPDDLGCENFTVPLDRRGVLAMCNDGRHNDCSTQFFVLLEPSEWMNHRYVAFGQLIDGKNTLKAIENVPTWYESPTLPILIEGAGILNMDCKRHPINKSTVTFLNKHIEDLVTLGELLFEALMARVWATISAKKQEKLEDKSSIRSSILGESDFSGNRDGSRHREKSLKDSEGKENGEFGVESYVPEENTYSNKSLSAKSSLMKPKRPYYLPLTDIPYPDEIDDEFDLKRFLQGHYCLECDLQLNLQKDEKKKDRLTLQYFSFPSDTLFDVGEHVEYNENIDSDEEEEIKNYIRNNVDRVSFAGGIIRNIVKGAAMFNLFEGARKSEMISIGDEDLKKLRRMSMFDRRQSMRKSEMIQLNDEELRQLRRTSMYERRMSTVVADKSDKGSQTTRKSGLPGLTDENLQKLRRMSMMDRSGAPVEHRQSIFGRRQSLFDPTSSVKKDPDVDMGINAEQLNKLRRISMFDQSRDASRATLLEKKVSISVPREGRTPSRIVRRPTTFSSDGANLPLKLPLIIEKDDEDEDDDDEGLSKQSAINIEELKKRRQTAFAEDLTRVKSFQKSEYSSSEEEEEEEEEESSDEGGGKIKIKLPPGADKVPKKIRRRPTGFVRPQDLKKYGMDDDDDAKVSIKLPEGATDTPTKIKRRQTGYFKASEMSQLAKDDIASVTIDAPSQTTASQIKRRQTGFMRPSEVKNFLEKYEDEENDEDEEDKEDEEEEEEEVEAQKTEYQQPAPAPEPESTRRVTEFAKDDELEKIKFVERKSSSSSISSGSDLHVQIDPSTIITRQTSHLRRPTGYVKQDQLPDDEETKIRTSVLVRLFEDSKLVDDDSPPPTLKTYVPISERIPHNILLTFDKRIREDTGVTQKDKEKEFLRQSINLEVDSIDHIVDPQYGKRVSAKISSEYVQRIQQLEEDAGSTWGTNKNLQSLRMLEYARSRPCLTIAEYREKNMKNLKKMKEEGKLKTTRDVSAKLPPIK